MREPVELGYPPSEVDERHRMWRVCGTTEPQRAMRGVDIVRFCVPVSLDDLSAHRMFRKVRHNRFARHVKNMPFNSITEGLQCIG